MGDSHKNERAITGAASIIGGATVVSRVLGYIRDAVIAYVFGAGLHSDAFFMAFRISNLLRRLLGEGALTSTFIPIFTEEMGKRDKKELRDMTSTVFTVFAIILIALAGAGMIFSRQIVTIMSPGFAADPLKFSLTINLTRIMFPFMLTVGLMAIAMGVLNSYRHFAIPAISPALFNIVIIISIFAFIPFLDEPIYAVAIGVLIGGAVQFIIHVPWLVRYGMSPRPLFNFKDPAIKKIFLLMAPAAFATGIYQLNIFVTLWFSSQLASGSVSYLYYSGRIMELPLGVFGVAISSAALPSLSAQVANKDWEGFKSSISFAVRLVNFIMLPATIGLLILSYPIIDILFRRGHFGPEAAHETAIALGYYAIGLVPVAGSRILISVFYSLKDTITPVWASAAAFIANLILCIVLVGPLKHGGLALATSISSIVNVAILLVILKKRYGRIGGRVMLVSAGKAALASIAMGAVIFIIIFKTGFTTDGAVYKSVFLALSLVAGIAVYLITARLLKTSEVMFLKGFLKKNR